MIKALNVDSNQTSSQTSRRLLAETKPSDGFKFIIFNIVNHCSLHILLNKFATFLELIYLERPGHIRPVMMALSRSRFEIVDFLLITVAFQLIESIN